MTPPLPLTGTCRCGGVTLRATAAPLITSACHCRGCQRMTASAYSLSALFPSDGFEATGETVIGGMHGPEQRHHHCARCLGWLFTRLPALDHVVNVRATMFDDTSWFAPFLETATDERLAWATVPAPRSFPSLPRAAEFGDLIAEYAAWDPSSIEET